MEEKTNEMDIKTVEDLENQEAVKEPQINYEEEYNKLLEENKSLKADKEKLIHENNRLFLKLTTPQEPVVSELENIINNL